MSNTLLQNVGFETFLNVEDCDLVGREGGLEDGFFGDVSSFPDAAWPDRMCSEVDEDDLSLTNYLLKVNADEEEAWESGEDLSVGGESVGDRDEVFELGWSLSPEDLDEGLFDALKPSCDGKRPSNKVKPGKVKPTSAKKTAGKGSKKEPGRLNKAVGNGKKQVETSPARDTRDVCDSDEFQVKRVKANSDAKVAVKSVCNSTKNEPPKCATTAKSQAEKAKEQRERKKKYVQELQDTIAELKRDKTGMQEVTMQLRDKIGSLKEEISYLKGIIANQSELASILRSVANTPGISISCSILQDNDGNSGKISKRKSDSGDENEVRLDQENNKKRKMDNDATSELDKNAGVCVHVQTGKVSLEFCAECSKKANGIHV